MFCPISVPFTREEVCEVLGINVWKYDCAVASGALKKSVNFDGRVSSHTALHSMYDIVACDVLENYGWKSQEIGRFHYRIDHDLQRIEAEMTSFAFAVRVIADSLADDLPTSDALVSVQLIIADELGRLVSDVQSTNYLEFECDRLGRDIVLSWLRLSQALREILERGEPEADAFCGGVVASGSKNLVRRQIPHI